MKVKIAPEKTTLWITDRGMEVSGFLASSPSEVELSNPEKPKTTSTMAVRIPPGEAPFKVSCTVSTANPLCPQMRKPNTVTAISEAPSNESIIFAES